MTNPDGRILGIDYGSQRVGVALSDPLHIIARSLDVLQNDDNLFVRIKELVEQYAVSIIVVGMPLTLRGEKSAKAKEVADFINALQETVKVAIVTADERFTSKIAHQTMITMGTSKKQRRKKERIDEMASALILQSYLDKKNNRRNTAPRN